MSLLHRRVLDRWEKAAARPPAERETDERLVDIAKGWITWQARSVIVECRERCGAQGLLENNGMTELVTGIEGAITAEGDNLAIHSRAAAGLLLDRSRAPREDPAADPTGGDLADLGFLGRLLDEVERIWFARAAARMARAADGEPLERWNAASGPALRGSRPMRTGRRPTRTRTRSRRCPVARPASGWTNWPGCSRCAGSHATAGTCSRQAN